MADRSPASGPGLLDAAPHRRRPVEPVAAAAALAVLVLAAGVGSVSSVGPGVAMAAVALAAGFACLVLGSVTVAAALVLAAFFLRLVPQLAALPVQPFTLAVGGLAGAVVIAVARRSVAVPRFGTVEALMAAYLAWNVLSALTPHELAATDPETGATVSARALVEVAVAVPILLYVAGTLLAERPRATRALLWTVLGFAGYSALVSVLQFTGPSSLVWPRYVVESPGWAGKRAVGVFNQPVENGLVLMVGVVVALHLATRQGATGRARVVAIAVAAPSLVAIYLTHTRALYLALAAVLVVGLVLVPRMRPLLALLLVAALGYVVLGWSSLASDDRAAGGVTSVNEIDDRLNLAATSLWAIGQEPLTGWGIGRFVAVDTIHHRQWSPDVSWVRGHGYASHENELGIAVELGLVGLGLWVTLLARIGWLLVTHVRRPDPARTESAQTDVRERAEPAILVLTAWLAVGTTVDLRYFAFSGAAVMLLLGMGVGPAPAPRAGVDVRVPT